MMAYTYGVRFNYKLAPKAPWELVEYDNREVAAVRSTYATKQEAEELARLYQADEDAGILIHGMDADDHHAMEAGMSTEVLAYYDDLPTNPGLVHPWRARQGG